MLKIGQSWSIFGSLWFRRHDDDETKEHQNG